MLSTGMKIFLLKALKSFFLTISDAILQYYTILTHYWNNFLIISHQNVFLCVLFWASRMMSPISVHQSEFNSIGIRI